MKTGAGMDLLNLLPAVSVLNRDNGKRFVDSRRLDAMAGLLWDSAWRRINPDGLFHCYARQPLYRLCGREAVVISAHADCAETITRCFSESWGNGLLKGTYDNAATNAAVLSLMLRDALPEDALVVFTGDEEGDSKGARHAARFFRENVITVRHLFVLDVTDMGWEEQADYTVENNFWRGGSGEKIIACACGLPCAWRFVPSGRAAVPGFVPPAAVIPAEAEADESWEYDKEGLSCCSLCLPVCGEMHSNAGVLVREASLRNYAAALEALVRAV